MSYTYDGDYSCMGITPPVSTEQKKILEANDKVTALLTVQKRVDEGLAKMKDGPAKQRLLQLRSQNRGYFTSYILPAYNRIKSYASSMFSGDDEDQTIGIFPLIPFAVAASATALVGYVAKSTYSEYKILNDPAFTAAQKAEIFGGGGLKAIAKAAGDTKTLAIVGVLGFLAWKFMGRKQ